MKKILAILFSLFFTAFATGGNLTLYVSGYVFEESSQAPVDNQLVTLKLKNEDPLILYFEKLHTNESGFFSTVIDIPLTSGVITISTIDCNNQAITHTVSFNTLKTHITSNFVICHDPLLTYCLSDFLYVPEPQLPYQFYFREAALGEIQSWLWDFGDGHFSDEPNPQHTYNVEGRYEVCLSVIGNDGTCNDQYCETLEVMEDALCEGLFTSFPFSGIDNTVQLWDLSSGDLTSWEWDFGDGNSSTQQNPVHAFATSGVFEVCLTVSDASGSCTSTFCDEVEATPVSECAADYSYFYDPTNPLTLQFLDFSEGEPDSWLWDFGDGTVSFIKNPVHIFPEEGIYDVCLTIFNQSNGCQDMYCEMVMVNNQIPCKSFFNYYQFSVDPYTYQFVDMSTGPIEVYEWDFGDGQTSNYQNPVHSYYENGAYEVCLTVSDESGACLNVFCETIYSGIIPDCEANYYYIQDSINPLTHYFMDISTGQIDFWEWDFGDGTASSEQSPTHIFPGEGIYLVNLSIGNYAGNCSDALCREVVVSGQLSCQADFDYFVFPENPFIVQFIDLSAGIVDVWIWDFGDGNFSFESNPIHTYENEGDFTVCLYVMNTLTGSTDQFCRDLQISNNPDCFADFTFMTVSECPFTIQFADQSGGSIVEWFWEFDDGSVSTLKNPVHTFSNEGIFKTCLTVNNLFGNCQETICKSVIIEIPDLCEAGFDYYLPLEQPLKVEFTDLSSGILNSWYWDFGDGIISEEQNPTHVYADSGRYIVQLSVFHDDSLIYCNSTILKPVLVYEEVPFCQAGFTAVPDSGINKPYLFHFTDISLGETDSWSWDFGDGTTSTLRNPHHQYSGPGDYPVKLTISGFNPYGENCYDSITQQMIMPEYYHIGGSVYGNNYPLNNPVHNGDTAIVYVYRYENEEAAPLDTASFTELGYFYFLNLLESDYLIKFQLSQGSTHFMDYFPTYFTNNLLWQDAGFLHLLDSNYYHADVFLKEIPDTETGIGEIAGNVLCYLEALGGFPLPSGNTEVLLFNAEMQAIAFKNTSEDGDFRFENLTWGTYFLLAESAGLYSEPVTITLSGTHPVVEDVLLNLYSSGLTGIHDHPVDLVEIQIYPNPVANILFVSINAYENEVLDFDISGIWGERILFETASVAPGKNSFRFNVSKLPHGMYVIKINSGNGRYYKSLKFIK